MGQDEDSSKNVSEQEEDFSFRDDPRWIQISIFLRQHAVYVCRRKFPLGDVDPEDLASQALLGLMSRMAGFDRVLSGLKLNGAYLTRVLENAANDEKRKQARAVRNVLSLDDTSLDMDPAGDDPRGMDALLLEHQRWMVGECLKTLTQEGRNAIIHWTEGRDFDGPQDRVTKTALHRLRRCIRNKKGLADFDA